jgi:hypothetical protein
VATLVARRPPHNGRKDGPGANARAAEIQPFGYQLQASYAEEARSLNQAGMLFSWFGPTTYTSP